MSPAEAIERVMFVSDVVAKVCDAPFWNEEYCAPIAVIPPPAPASAPQENCPVGERPVKWEVYVKAFKWTYQE